MNNKPEIESVSIRFPKNIKEWLEQQAAKNFRSQSAQVLSILQERIEAEQREKAA
jgi:hypothetical protein